MIKDNKGHRVSYNSRSEGQFSVSIGSHYSCLAMTTWGGAGISSPWGGRSILERRSHGVAVGAIHRSALRGTRGNKRA